MKFKDLNLSNEILNALEKEDYVNPTLIQEMAIPHILMKKDVIGIAQTGTGKTAAFSLPLLERLIKEYQADKKIKVLVLTPTRELAVQIRDSFRKYAINTEYKCSVVLGGVNQKSQLELLRKGVDVLVATPGRLLDLVNSKKAKLDNVEMVVLDEADTMLDMGFIKDVNEILSHVSKNRQTLLFSATFSSEIKPIADKFLKNPKMIQIKEENSNSKIKQFLYYVDKKNKLDLLLNLLSSKEKKTTIIFVRTKKEADVLSISLKEYAIKTSVIHGDRTQSNRVKALADFKNGKTNVMIATDIAARGIDIKGLDQVINYDIPKIPELYIHRIGRTARAGLEGTSLSLCSIDEVDEIKAIEKLTNEKMEVIEHRYPMKETIKKAKKDHKKSDFRPCDKDKFKNYDKKKQLSNKYKDSYKNHKSIKRK